VRRALRPAAVIGLLALGASIGLSVLQPRTPPTRAEQAAALAAELRCPDCQSLSVAESRTAAADAIRREIANQLAAGRSADEVRQHFVARYGQWILLQPADPLIWLLPAVALLAGIGAFAWWLRRSAAAPGPIRTPAGIDDADRRRVRDEVEALDG
jgi:cytochrome c-type biogenesis protein CcmH